MKLSLIVFSIMFSISSFADESPNTETRKISNDDIISVECEPSKRGSFQLKIVYLGANENGRKCSGFVVEGDSPNEKISSRNVYRNTAGLKIYETCENTGGFDSATEKMLSFAWKSAAMTTTRGWSRYDENVYNYDPDKRVALSDIIIGNFVVRGALESWISRGKRRLSSLYCQTIQPLE